MKKILTLLLILCLLCGSAAGCGSGGTAQPESYVTAAPGPSESVTAGPDTGTSPQEKNAAVPESAAQTDGADVDLTALSSTMVYAEVYNMMANPGDYLGKTVKMSGPYYALYYNETEQYYHYVIVEDATACCQQGLEFVLSGQRSYPDDYPADTSRIVVTGVFESYEEFGTTYFRLAADNVTLL